MSVAILWISVSKTERCMQYTSVEDLIGDHHMVHIIQSSLIL